MWKNSESSHAKILPKKKKKTANVLRQQILLACLASLPFVAIRIGWGVAYLELKIHHPNSGFLTSLAVMVCLNVVPEMVIIAVLLAAGVATHRLQDAMTAGTRSRSGRR